jgi:hypothetical protein
MSIAKKIITNLDCCFSGATGITMGNEEDIAKSASSDKDRTFKEGNGTTQQKEKPAPSSSSETTSGVDPRNPYNDPTLPYYNPDLEK